LNAIVASDLASPVVGPLGGLGSGAAVPAKKLKATADMSWANTGVAALSVLGMAGLVNVAPAIV
jgi:hypothetical protein